MALIKILYPTFQRNFEYACCRKLYNWLKVAPYQVDPQVEDEDDFDIREGVRVLSIAYSTERDVPAFCALLDGDGEVVEYFTSTLFVETKTSWREDERNSKEKDLNSLRKTIFSKKPHVVVVAGESREAMMVVDDVKSVINDLVDNEGFPSYKWELMDNELGILYMNCNKRGVVEVNKDDLMNALYLEFVNRTNEVGVDLNRAVQFSHTANIVQFVCAFGPRKAAFILKLLKSHNKQLESRAMLVFLHDKNFRWIDIDFFADMIPIFFEY
ncbi:transcription elongation factor SPT6 [Caerostris extrusa]|uniref:Transcription elongation factor SPT6 n=1 Tax=Caerostris extrusa TaxID=172846 RepID=A0AAV4WN73_CAEEX|nr:transcription elongation factor SPT6 [Caerostris extrusa]